MRELGAQGIGPQDSTSAMLARGFEAEQRGAWAEAAEAYRRAAHGSRPQQAVLGLERVDDAAGEAASLLPLLDTLLAARPRDPVLHAAQLRVDRALGRPDDERAAFERWARSTPGDATPYREYARLLLEDGRGASADSVLARGTASLGSGRGFMLETAQLRAALGRWAGSAAIWRPLLDTSAALAESAAFALGPTPDSLRPAIRAVLAAPPLTLGARLALADLELGWGSARAGWMALASLAPAPGVVAEWEQYGDAAQLSGNWLVARDAFSAVLAAQPGDAAHVATLAVRAGSAALHGGDAASALALAERAAAVTDSESAARTVLDLRVRALGMLGRPDEAAHLAAAYGRWLDPRGRSALTREVAWGFVRAGDVDRARAAVWAAGVDDRELDGWLALFGGDLRAARANLRAAAAPTTDLVTALALLGRTRVDSAPVVGHAFVALARGDSAAAARAFADAGGVVLDAAPLLLAEAARLHAAMHEDAAAVPIWRQVVERYADAPEAPEADLEWGRALRRDRDLIGAEARWEHLILTYPLSALVPQARRELDAAHRLAPPASSQS